MFTPTVTFWMSYEKKKSLCKFSELTVRNVSKGPLQLDLKLQYPGPVPSTEGPGQKQKFLMGDPEASFPPDRNGHDCMICAIRKAGKTEMCPKQDVFSLKEEK